MGIAMRELTGAFISLPWAMTLFGVQQASRVLTRQAGGMQTVEAGLYAATKATELQMSDVFWAAYQVGDSAQRTAVDLCSHLVTRHGQDPGFYEELMLDVTEQASESAATLLSSDGRAAVVTQLMNSLEVFNLVKNVRTILDIPVDGRFPLASLVRQANALGGFRDLWAIEGLGHDYADRFADGDRPIAGILQNEWARDIPRSSLPMLHAGIGLSFARRLMSTLTPYDHDRVVRDGLRQFIALCEDNSWPAYEGAALESLGLVTRTWHPLMVRAVDEGLAATNTRAREFFWHGVGRALYFHPLYIVPGILSPWRAADREPPDELARLNMKAGLAWATTLVNRRHPAVLAQLLAMRGADLERDDAFTSGLVSSLVMCQETTPRNSGIAALADDRPDPSSGDTPWWECLVAAPVRDAMTRIQPALTQLALIGEVFRHHSYPGWFDAALLRTGERAGASPAVH
jgi:hypothetical protein